MPDFQKVKGVWTPRAKGHPWFSNMISGKSELTSRIREEAGRLGFFKVGITAVRPLPRPEYLTEWISRGFHGEMRYLERQSPKRLDPGLVFAGARSILTLPINYRTEHDFSDEPLKGKISRYGWGEDYHITVKAPLEELLRLIREREPSAQGLCYVDTGPIMEKVWGAQTSLGWLGKHTNLITRARGSWFFIGIILLNLELEYDTPARDYCGKCNRCIQACPTGAIVAPYVLDARLCISYLTVELRGEIPVGLRPLIGNRIFGCDDCQEVCPWNRFASADSAPCFRPREENLMPDLAALIRITPEQFKLRFKNSPVLRATRDGLVRNVAIALGNSGRREAIPVLSDALQDSSPLVRSHAEWALERLRSL